MLNLLCIKTAKCVYISDNNNKPGSYFGGSKIPHLRFDGKAAKPTYRSDWFELPEIPTSVDEVLRDKGENYRYELQEGYPVGDKTPAVINVNYIDTDSPYWPVRGLYIHKWDTVPGGTRPVEVKWVILDEISDFEIVKSEFKAEPSLLSQIQFHPVLHQQVPCRLTPKQSFGIIREYIKDNIDPKWAVITSDYAFCFAVQKRIKLTEPHEYQVDVNMWSGLMGRKKKPKCETRYRTHRDVVIFEMAPEPYQKYPLATTFVGSSQKDLEQQVKTYLKDLITKINAPLVDCPHCHGQGVI